MSSIFSTNGKERKGYRDTFSRMIAVLEYLQKKNGSTKWRMSCVLQTSTTSIENIVTVAEGYNLVYQSNKEYRLTVKGKKLLEVLSA